MTSNTNKELYEWAWDQYHLGNEIDLLIRQLKRDIQAHNLARQSTQYASCLRRNVSVDVGYAPLLIEALEKLQ